MKGDILQLFAKPIYRTIMPVDFIPLIKWFNTQKMSGEEDGDVKNYGSQSLDTYIFSNKECKEISDYILKIVKDFADMLGYQYESYKFTQSWLTWKYPGQSHISHTHANSLISGVFYYDYVDKNTPSIIFSDDEFLSLNFKPSHKPNSNYRFSYHIEEIKVEPGMLLLFPSYVSHGVPINNTNYIRKSLSFNVVPKKGLGDEKFLTELLF